MKNFIKVLIIALFLSANLFVVTASAEPNPYEDKLIKNQIKASFRHLMNIWKEELYFDMYDFGQKNSQKKLSKVEFAQRMVDLYWKPTLRSGAIEKIKLDYRSLAEVHSTIEFENKVNPERKIKKELFFIIIIENKKWKYNLAQLIKTPYDGKLAKPKIKKPEPSLAGNSKEEKGKKKDGDKKGSKNKDGEIKTDQKDKAQTTQKKDQKIEESIPQ